MAKPKVTYFDFAGSRGEEVRLALVIAGVPFDDNRLDRDAFMKVKTDQPYGALPTLEIDGRGVFAQTNAILRLIGRGHGMHPEDMFEAARHDALMEAVEELRLRVGPTMRMPDGPEKLAARKQLAEEFVGPWGRYVEQQIGAGPFVGGEKPSVADIKLYMADKWISSGSLDGIPATIFDGSPKLKKIAEGIRTHPAVVAWYAR